jgi:hypothetical protein
LVIGDGGNLDPPNVVALLDEAGKLLDKEGRVLDALLAVGSFLEVDQDGNLLLVQKRCVLAHRLI